MSHSRLLISVYYSRFVPDENNGDSVRLRLGISRSDRLSEKRTALLEKIAVATHGDFLISDFRSTPIETRLLAFTRVHQMNEQQLDTWLAQNDVDAEELLVEQSASVPRELDAKAWSFLSARLDLLLRSCLKILEQDEKRLSNLSPTGILAIRFITSLKTLYESVRAYTLKRSQELS